MNRDSLDSQTMVVIPINLLSNEVLNRFSDNDIILLQSALHSEQKKRVQGRLDTQHYPKPNMQERDLIRLGKCDDAMMAYRKRVNNSTSIAAPMRVALAKIVIEVERETMGKPTINLARASCPPVRPNPTMIRGKQ